MPSPESQNMYAALKAAFDRFLEEYLKLKGSDEISDVELEAAGNGFKAIADNVVATNNARIASGDTDGIRQADRRVALHPVRERVTLTPSKRR